MLPSRVCDFPAKTCTIYTMSDPLSSTYARSFHQSDSDAVTPTIPPSKATMLGRLRSSSRSSMDAQYHALPQSPDISQDIRIPSAIEEGVMGEEEGDDSILDDDLAPSNVPVDSRIQWTHFALGAAVLLPWNGASWTASLACHCSQPRLTEVPPPHSHDYRRTLFPLTIATPLSPQHLCLIPRNHVHTLQLCIPCSRHGDVEEGMSFPRCPLRSR